MKTFKADLFIVPNRASDLEWFMKFSNGVKRPWIKLIESFLNIELNNPAEKLIEVWVTGKDSDNFSAHGFTNSKGESTRFPVSLPASLLAGKKEGDLLIIENEHGRFELACIQRTHRYRMWGAFEEAYRYVTI